ncbi:unnamed protein product [Rotaria sp. Silwood2]|nr:unnamed protein product [Rotaria sp. Silwood2]
MVIMELPPFIILKNPTATYREMTDNYKKINITEFYGFYKDVLLYLQNKMGFIPVITLAKPTTEYNELVEGVANGLFDTVMTTIIITEKRRRIVDFSIALLPSSIRVITRKVKSSHLDLLFFLKPFTWQLWLVILATIPITTILLWYFESQNGDASDNTINNRIGRSFSYTLHSMLGTDSYYVASSAGRLLAFGLHILRIILFAVYTANLLSYIIIQKAAPTISGIDDIKNGKISPDRIGIVVGSAVEDYYLNSISQRKKDYYPLKTADEIYTTLINGNIDAGLWNNLTIEYHTSNIYCDLMPVGVEFSHSSYQLPVKKDWLYKADLDFNILSLIESEELDRISSKWLTPHSCSRVDPFGTKGKSITLETTGGLYITFFIFIITSIVIHFGQRWVTSYRTGGTKRRKSLDIHSNRPT